MGVYAKDVANLVGTATDESTPLGERLYGVAEEFELDSIEEVRDVRERI